MEAMELGVCYKRAAQKHWGHGGSWSTGEKGGGWPCCRRASVHRNRTRSLTAIGIPASTATGNRVPRLRGQFGRHGQSYGRSQGRRPVVRWLPRDHRGTEKGMAAWRKRPHSRPDQDWNESFCVDVDVVEAVVEGVDGAEYIASAHRSPF